VEAIFVVGALVIGSVILTLVTVVFSDDTAAPKGAGYRRVTLVIGFAIVAAGVSILFLDVGAWDTYSFEPGGKFHVDCGTAWHAMFSKDHNFPNSACAEPAYARLWIAGGVAVVGMGVAFWGAGRRRLSAMVSYALLATVLVRLLALVASSSFGGGASVGRVLLPVEGFRDRGVRHAQVLGNLTQAVPIRHRRQDSRDAHPVRVSPFLTPRRAVR
jgi:hypothetical protein